MISINCIINYKRFVNFDATFWDDIWKQRKNTIQLKE